MSDARRDLITNNRSPAARITTRASTLLSLNFSFQRTGYMSTDYIYIIMSFRYPCDSFW